MKKTIWIMYVLFCVIVLSISVSAASPYVIDRAGLLSERELDDLEAEAARLSVEMGVDIVILTEEDIGKEEPLLYAADFYDYGGYAMDGVILLLDMEERDWRIVTSGTCIYTVNEQEISEIGDKMVPYLSRGEYAAGFQVFLEETVYYMCMESYENAWNDSENIYYEEEYIHHVYPDTYTKTVSVPQCIGVGGIIGAVIGLIVCLVMKSQMNTAKPQFAAGHYIVENSFDLVQSRDRFLYSNVSKVARPKEQNHSGGGGSFRGSSGRSHGGGGGKF